VALRIVNTWLKTGAAYCRIVNNVGDKDRGHEGLKRVDWTKPLEQTHEPHDQADQSVASAYGRDTALRKLSPQTRAAYIRAVKNFTRFLKQAPDTASAEDLTQYQLHLVEHSSGYLNATITGLRFCFETTLERPEAMTKMSHVYEPRKLPVILSLEETTRQRQASYNP